MILKTPLSPLKEVADPAVAEVSMAILGPLRKAAVCRGAFSSVFQWRLFSEGRTQFAGSIFRVC